MVQFLDSSLTLSIAAAAVEEICIFTVGDCVDHHNATGKYRLCKIIEIDITKKGRILHILPLKAYQNKLRSKMNLIDIKKQKLIHVVIPKDKANLCKAGYVSARPRHRLLDLQRKDIVSFKIPYYLKSNNNKNVKQWINAKLFRLQKETVKLTLNLKLMIIKLNKYGDIVTISVVFNHSVHLTITIKITW